MKHQNIYKCRNLNNLKKLKGGNKMKIATVIQEVVKHLHLRQNIDEERYVSELLQTPSRPSIIICNIDERRFIIGFDHHHHNGHHRH